MLWFPPQDQNKFVPLCPSCQRRHVCSAACSTHSAKWPHDLFVLISWISVTTKTPCLYILITCQKHHWICWENCCNFFLGRHTSSTVLDWSRGEWKHKSAGVKRSFFHDYIHTVRVWEKKAGRRLWSRSMLGCIPHGGRIAPGVTTATRPTEKHTHARRKHACLHIQYARGHTHSRRQSETEERQYSKRQESGLWSTIPASSYPVCSLLETKPNQTGQVRSVQRQKLFLICAPASLIRYSLAFWSGAVVSADITGWLEVRQIPFLWKKLQ